MRHGRTVVREKPKTGMVGAGSGSLGRRSRSGKENVPKVRAGQGGLIRRRKKSSQALAYYVARHVQIPAETLDTAVLSNVPSAVILHGNYSTTAKVRHTRFFPINQKMSRSE